MTNRRLINSLCSLAVWWLLTTPSAVWAQAPTLTGTVVDALSGKPVPFAVVEVRRLLWGVQATEQGTVTLSLPATLEPSDRLQVSSLGFETLVVAVPTASPFRVALRPLAVALPEAVVRPPTPPVQLGSADDGKPFGFGGGANLDPEHNRGWQVAQKFSDAPAGIMQAVRFYVKPGLHCGKASVTAPFRVRVYAANGAAGAPGTDLLMASVVTNATAAGWHEVDLSAYRVAVPAEGFFVAMEWLYTRPEFGCNYTYTSANKEKKTGYYYGQTLGGHFSKTAPPGWYLSAGYPWQQFRPLTQFADKGVQNAAIQAIVQPE